MKLMKILLTLSLLLTLGMDFSILDSPSGISDEKVIIIHTDKCDYNLVVSKQDMDEYINGNSTVIEDAVVEVLDNKEDCQNVYHNKKGK